MDINGDGLPDLVSKKESDKYFLVQYNLGDTFSSNQVQLYRPDWPEFNLENDIKQDLQTIRDNLSGFGSFSSSGSLAPKTSNILSDYGDPFSINDTISCSKGFGINLGASFAQDIPVPPFILITLTFGLNGAYAETSTSLSMMDINGDGLPDHVLKIPGRPLYVKLNQSGKVGLLKEVHLPTGGSYSLEYGRVGNTVDMPQSRMVLSTITMNDGYEDSNLDGEHSYKTNYDYGEGYYNRSERQFYGFGKVKTINADNSAETIFYQNRDYYYRGLAYKKIFESAEGKLLRDISYSYQMLRDYTTPPTGPDVKSPRMILEITEQFETEGSDSIKTSIEYTYNKYGEILTMNDFGVSGYSDDNIYLSLTYADLSSFSGYIPSRPETLEVRDFKGNLMRKRAAEYDQYGNMSRHKQYYTTNDFSLYAMDYDYLGNIILIKGPRGSEVRYTYDDRVHSYVTGISNGNSAMNVGFYTSTIEWDYALGVDLLSRDINEEEQIKRYDNFGRLVEIRTPYDWGSIPAVSYEYLVDSSNRRQAITRNKLSHDADDDSVIKTLVMTDGLGRVLQTAKEGERYTGDTGTQGWNITGRLLFDSKGRPVEEGQNGFIEGVELPGLLSVMRPTKKEYDVLDRIVRIELPDFSDILTEYGIENNHYLVITTDPEGNKSENYSTIRGNISEIRKKDASGTVLTSAEYKYNILNELLQVKDHQNNIVSYSYDILGRNLSVNSPDAGYITSAYDIAGNLIEKTDNNLRAENQVIRYVYDGLNRLIKIDYPYMEDSIYTYGKADHNENGAGRLIETLDESGTISNDYGKLGEVIRVSRTLNRITPSSSAKTMTMQYQSDYLGRMENITYPDGEVISYGYDHGGQVTSVTGKRGGTVTNYIEKIAYDEFGQRTLIRYGTGIETTYEYDPYRRWLTNLTSSGTYGNTLQNITYQFDNVGNIESLENGCDRYKTTQTYTYDDLYQLTSAKGVYESKPYGSLDYKSTYTQNFAFDSIGNMMSKNSTQFYNPSRSGSGTLNYQFEYEYYEDKPHQAERIGNLWYLYDENGNVVEEREGGHSSPSSGFGGAGLFQDGDLRWTGYGFGLDRSESEDDDIVYNRNFIWDEENRLKQSSDDNYTVDYLYDTSGERTVKNSSLGETLYFNSFWQVSMETDGNRQSKHIYVGESRIATRLNMEGDSSNGYEVQNTYYYHSDHLGSANIVTDYQGNVFEHMEYTPYGEMWVEESADSFDKIPFRFTAKEWDEETRLYYMSARYQNPMTSRWMSADPLGSQLVNPNRDGFALSESLNWYSYVSNNPLKYVDPTGLAEIEADQIYGDEFIDMNGDVRSPTFLDERVAEEAEKRVGDDYVYGGKPDNNRGGLDCSGFAEDLMEKISGVNVGERNADGQAKDPNLTLPGDGSRGSLNFYDWKGDGKVDHVAVELGDRNIINPKGDASNTSFFPGVIEKRGPFNTSPVNRKINWRYLLSE
jgi:RHS repeat-associated protein